MIEVEVNFKSSGLWISGGELNIDRGMLASKADELDRMVMRLRAMSRHAGAAARQDGEDLPMQPSRRSSAKNIRLLARAPHRLAMRTRGTRRRCRRRRHEDRFPTVGCPSGVVGARASRCVPIGAGPPTHAGDARQLAQSNAGTSNGEPTLCLPGVRALARAAADRCAAREQERAAQGDNAAIGVVERVATYLT